LRKPVLEQFFLVSAQKRSKRSVRLVIFCSEKTRPPLNAATFQNRKIAKHEIWKFGRQNWNRQILPAGTSGKDNYDDIDPN